ncbi:MAG: VWA domain-containing protein [Pseudomonadota bacterium]
MHLPSPPCTARRGFIALASAVVVSALAPSGLAHAAGASPDVRVSATLSHSKFLRGPDGALYLQVKIDAGRQPRATDRPPLNLALVIDKSGSMRGDRIDAARRAALMAIDRLDHRDIVSLISYSDEARVLIPATRATDKRALRRTVRRLLAGGSTAIHDGVTTAARELEKFQDDGRSTRLILLSDGLANIGPKSPAHFEDLGRRLSERGMFVSTIGLGTSYNEDLMAGLARTGEGNHAFVQEPADLTAFFNREFDEAIGVAIQDIEIIITLKRGFKPIDTLGREGEITGRKVRFKVGQLVGGGTQVLLAKIAAPDDDFVGAIDVADVQVSYRRVSDGRTETTRVAVASEIATGAREHTQSVNRDVIADVTVLEARRQRDLAIKLHDQGRLAESRKAFEASRGYIRKRQQAYGLEASAELNKAADASAESEAAISSGRREAWKSQRKSLRSLESNNAGSLKKY